MEAFIVAIVLITVLIMGGEQQQADPDSSHAIETTSSKDQTVNPEHSVSVCVPGHYHSLQRDLTVPHNQPVSDDDH